jgi:undecaprenyl-diphosphatase
MNPLIEDVVNLLSAWDLRLFQAIHPSLQPSPEMIYVARAFADGPLIVMEVSLAVMIFLPRTRSVALRAAVAVACALTLNAFIGVVWERSRPFAAGAGQAWVSHAANGSFPSHHLTAQWVVAGVLLLDRRTRVWGLLFGLLGLPMAWARIYLGVHYPSDMMGAFAMGALAMIICWAWWRPPRS